MGINADGGPLAMGRSLSRKLQEYSPNPNDEGQVVIMDKHGSEEWSRAETEATKQEEEVNNIKQLS